MKEPVRLSWTYSKQPAAAVAFLGLCPSYRGSSNHGSSTHHSLSPCIVLSWLCVPCNVVGKQSHSQHVAETSQVGAALDIVASSHLPYLWVPSPSTQSYTLQYPSTYTQYLQMMQQVAKKPSLTFSPVCFGVGYIW